MYDLDQALLISDLADITAKLPRRDNILAGKMIEWFDTKGHLSAKQVAVVRDILSRNQGV